MVVVNGALHSISGKACAKLLPHLEKPHGDVMYFPQLVLSGAPPCGAHAVAAVHPHA